MPRLHGVGRCSGRIGVVIPGLVAGTVVSQRVGSQISPDIFTCPFLGQAAGRRQSCLTDGLRRRRRLRWGRLWLASLRCWWLGLWSVGSRRVHRRLLSNPQHFVSWRLVKKREAKVSRKKKLCMVFPIPSKGDYAVPETCRTAALPSFLVGKKQALSHALEIHSYVFCQRGCRATHHAPSQTLHSLQQPGLTLKRFQRKAASHTTEREF